MKGGKEAFARMQLLCKLLVFEQCEELGAWGAAGQTAHSQDSSLTYL